MFCGEIGGLFLFLFILVRTRDHKACPHLAQFECIFGLLLNDAY